MIDQSVREEDRISTGNARRLPVLSHFQTAGILGARREERPSAATSIDLGLTATDAALDGGGVTFADGTHLAWPEIEEIDRNRTVCFRVEEGKAVPIRAFSEETGRAYALLPTVSAPALVMSGFLMHRIKDTDPIRSAQEMVRAVAPVRGAVLDTATGLGYTAIEASRTADRIITVEIDSCVHVIARQNPWSRPLFDERKITRIRGDSFEEIAQFSPESFSAVIHDPPAMSLAGELYSEEFYRRVHRVLDRRGRMFHYIGAPESASGSRVTRGVIRRLRDAGFSRIGPAHRAFGVVAYKGGAPNHPGHR